MRVTHSQMVRTPSKVDPALYLNHSAGKSTEGFAEIRILYVCAVSIKSKGLQVQKVEDVEKVGLEFEVRSLAKELWHAKPLCHC